MDYIAYIILFAFFAFFVEWIRNLLFWKDEFDNERLMVTCFLFAILIMVSTMGLEDDVENMTRNSIKWLNANNGAIIAIATIAIVSATFYNSRLTGRLLKANHDTPEIAIYLVKRERGIFICIENIGTGAAHDLKFTLKRGIDRLKKKSIGYLKPGGQRIYLFDTKNSVDITVEYKDSTWKKYTRFSRVQKFVYRLRASFSWTIKMNYTDSFHLDTSELDNSVMVADDYIEKTPRNLKKEK